ncbi:MAG TPA: hypothetical protein VFO10_01610 [Oligoflexus sp.]|uniref:hypothetical protein n=1 Tax=Oligoflexus sp. TaxID=1971216 RepID=UPI002D7FAED0|nr:hypothetical protein [Oligoflexus sp.]HET9235913.1 hypothetical protein [Oligoflexus sp.]
MKLLTIRSEIEKSVKLAVPGWKLFSANTIPATDDDYPCINTFFDSDRLISDEGPQETRRVIFQLEAGFNVESGDPEADLVELRQRIEHAVELNQDLKDQVTKIRFVKVDFVCTHDGAKQRALLFMTAWVHYQKPRACPPPPVISPNLRPVITCREKSDE